MLKTRKFHRHPVFIQTGLFSARLNSAEDCDLVLSRPELLDRESVSEFRVEVAVDTLSAFANPKRRKATVSKIQWALANLTNWAFIFTYK